MRKAVLVPRACSNPPCSAPEACKHQKDAYNPQHELQSDRNVTPDIIKKTTFGSMCDCHDPKDVKSTNKSPNFIKHTRGHCKAYIEATKFSH